MPWLLALLASCGDDGTSTSAPASSDSTESTTTASTTAVADESSTSAPGTSALTSGGTSTGSGSDSDTTGADDLAPVAIDDTYFATQDLALAVAADAGVAANDVDDGALGVSDFDAMSQGGGTVQLAPDGSVAYTPASGFWGRDSFGYTIADAAGATASATVTVYVAPVLIPLGDVADGFGGFVLDGGPGDESGSAVGRAGDVNGDGRDDLIVGAPVADANGSNAGRVYVVFGKADTDPVALTNLGDGGFAIDGAAPDDLAGASLGGGMDLDGDGLAELLVGASHADPNGASSGRAYVVFGKADTDPIDLAMLGGAGFTLSGELAGDRAGESLDFVPDVDGDGIAEIVIGASRNDAAASNAGRSYVVFGKTDTDPIELAMLGEGGFTIDGEASLAHCGQSVSNAGDVDGDGLADVVVGAPGAQPNAAYYAGRAYVVFGKGDSTAVDGGQLGAAGFVLDGEAASDRAGYTVSGTGDVDGDGLDDLVVGSVDGAPSGMYAGRSYVVFGKADTQAVDLAALGDGGFFIDGGAQQDTSSFALGRAGDVNGDGLADVLVGAPGAHVAGPIAGRAYVVFGKADTSPVSLAELGTAGVVLESEGMGDNTGWSVQGAGDVDGDGFDDVIVGAPNADPNGPYSGRSYVVFGVPTADNCCRAHERGGCTDAVIEACVCALDPGCCEAWDDLCTAAAADDCSACG